MAHEHIKERIRQHSHELSPRLTRNLLDHYEAALLEFVLSEIASAEQRGHDRHMNPEREERNILRHLLVLAKKQSVQLAVLIEQTKPKVSRWMVIIWPLEPIQKKDTTMDPINLGKIPLGQRLPVQIVPDEPVDVKPDGNFAAVAILSGDSSASVANGSDPIPARRSTPTSSFVYFNGDGAVGPKSATVSVDGHVGDGDVEVTQEFDWEVISPDATAFKATPSPLEPIPTLPTP